MTHRVTPDRKGFRSHLFGISAALVTPFDDDGSVNLQLAARQARRVLANGADGVTLFGTTGEGASIGQAERSAILEAIIEAGVPVEKMTACVVACALEQALQQARDAIGAGVTRLLLTPPFYFKGVAEPALFAWFAEFIETLAEPDVQIILYHIPQVTGVGLPISLVRDLKERFGATIFGVKDSSGDWPNARQLLEFDDLAILIGDERLLSHAASLGGAGAISGMANLVPARLTHMIRTGESNSDLSRVVDQIVAYPVTPLVKAMVGALHGEDGWLQVRAPLDQAEPAIASRLVLDLSGGVRP